MEIAISFVLSWHARKPALPSLLTQLALLCLDKTARSICLLILILDCNRTSSISIIRSILKVQTNLNRLFGAVDSLPLFLGVITACTRLGTKMMSPYACRDYTWVLVEFMAPTPILLAIHGLILYEQNYRWVPVWGASKKCSWVIYTRRKTRRDSQMTFYICIKVSVNPLNHTPSFLPMQNSTKSIAVERIRPGGHIVIRDLIVASKSIDSETNDTLSKQYVEMLIQGRMTRLQRVCFPVYWVCYR